MTNIWCYNLISTKIFCFKIAFSTKFNKLISQSLWNKNKVNVLYPNKSWFQTPQTLRFYNVWISKSYLKSGYFCLYLRHFCLYLRHFCHKSQNLCLGWVILCLKSRFHTSTAVFPNLLKVKEHLTVKLSENPSYLESNFSF